jgi:Domain of unknown function (DUF5655)
MAYRTWEDIRDSIAARLVRQTSHDVAWWNARVGEQPEIADEAALRAWLTAQGVTGYQQMLLVMERFGYPDFLLASAGELIDGQYAGREALRPILDAVLIEAAAFGDVDVQARKTYTTLLTPRRTFAAVRPTTKTRVDLALRIDGETPGGRLLDGSTTAGGGVNLRVPLASPDDFDDEAIGLLHRAYQANL